MAARRIELGVSVAVNLSLPPVGRRAYAEHKLDPTSAEVVRCTCGKEFRPLAVRRDLNQPRRSHEQLYEHISNEGAVGARKRAALATTTRNRCEELLAKWWATVQVDDKDGAHELVYRLGQALKPLMKQEPEQPLQKRQRGRLITLEKEEP